MEYGNQKSENERKIEYIKSDNISRDVKTPGFSSFWQIPENAPVDDEPYTDADEAAGREAEEDLKEGRTVSLNEFAKKFPCSISPLPSPLCTQCLRGKISPPFDTSPA